VGIYRYKIVTKRWAYNPTCLSIGGLPKTLRKHLRYLGIILDTRLSFGETVAKHQRTLSTEEEIPI